MRQIISGNFSRGTIGAAAAVAILLAGSVAVVSLTGGGHGTDSHTVGAAADSHAVTGGASGANAASAARLPQLAAAPQVAAMPKSAARGSQAAKPAPSSGHPKPSASSPTSAGPSSGATLPPPVGTGSATCTKPQFVTSDPFGMWNQAPYFVYNDMWNVANYTVSQTLYACSYSDWYVVATANNNNGDGAVKTYPDSHRDFDSEPQINSFHSVTSTFAETSPHTGIYEDAYDIWLNGVATSASTEVMIWNENFHQTPCCTNEGTATFSGQTYTVWKNGSYIAFVANSNFTSGTVDLLSVFKWIISRGWIPANSTLGAVDYGAEIVSTNNAPATFSFSNFSVTAQLRGKQGEQTAAAR